MIVYVSAPYSIGDVSENIRRACFAGDEILKKGHTPFIPHLTHLWHLISPKNYDEWLAIDMKYLERCDAIVRLPGESNGADLEIKFAQMRSPKILIYDGVGSIPKKGLTK